MAREVDPRAIVSETAELGQDVRIGPYAIVEDGTRLGDGCRIHAAAIIRRGTRLGCRNVVYSHAVLGGEPQDFKYDATQESFVRIGDDNVFREGVTINRGTGPGSATTIGNSNFFMTCSHVGHNSVVGSNCIMTNGSALAGHVELGDRAILSANVVIHQFCWVGEMVMSRGNAASAMHVPPYCMLGGVTELNGLNKVGLRRAPHLTDKDRAEIHEAYRLLYRSGLPATKALAEMDARTDWGAAAGRFRDFVRRVITAEAPHNRGLCKDVTKHQR
ncbi:MAG: acyl-ACP--UDP-N-acetylglucosamine O-acyltransferase [Planctomycetes bacterium]|nr:acyl-ACP--UDP-N-acetylglucosamine O-acyltransferase [Planctomycetota bacterium]